MLITIETPKAASCRQNAPSLVPSLAGPSTHATTWQVPTTGTFGAFTGTGLGVEGTRRVSAPVSLMRDRIVEIPGSDAGSVQAAKQGSPPRGELH